MRYIESKVIYRIIGVTMAENKVKKPRKKKPQEEELPLITLDSCESFDPSKDKIEATQEGCEPDYDLDSDED